MSVNVSYLGIRMTTKDIDGFLAYVAGICSVSNLRANIWPRIELLAQSNSEINSWIIGQNHNLRNINDIFNNFRELRLDISSIQNDERLCYLVWLKAYQFVLLDRNIFHNNLPLIPQMPLQQLLGSPLFGISHQERCSEVKKIIYFLEGMNRVGVSVATRGFLQTDFLSNKTASSLIQILKSNCTTERKIKFLDEISEDLSDWMLQTAQKEFNWERILWHPLTHFDDKITYPPIGHPPGHEERKLFIQAQIDMLDGYVSSSYTSSFSKKWAQKKYRQSKKNLKPINLHLRPDTHEEFMALKREYGLNKADLLDKIIREHYRKLFGVKK